ncbi:hypothetical protein [Natrinema thermotolerans]
MKLSQWITVIAVALVLGASLLNPGGGIIALIIAGVILVVYALGEFLPEYILVTNQGKNARKDKQRRRRARGLNPFSRSSKRKRDARETNSQSSTDGGRDE